MSWECIRKYQHRKTSTIHKYFGWSISTFFTSNHLPFSISQHRTQVKNAQFPKKSEKNLVIKNQIGCLENVSESIGIQQQLHTMIEESNLFHHEWILLRFIAHGGVCPGSTYANGAWKVEINLHWETFLRNKIEEIQNKVVNPQEIEDQKHAELICQIKKKSTKTKKTRNCVIPEGGLPVPDLNPYRKGLPRKFWLVNLMYYVVCQKCADYGAKLYHFKANVKQDGKKCRKRDRDTKRRYLNGTDFWLK